MQSSRNAHFYTSISTHVHQNSLCNQYTQNTALRTPVHVHTHTYVHAHIRTHVHYCTLQYKSGHNITLPRPQNLQTPSFAEHRANRFIAQKIQRNRTQSNASQQTPRTHKQAPSAHINTSASFRAERTDRIQHQKQCHDQTSRERGKACMHTLHTLALALSAR